MKVTLWLESQLPLVSLRSVTPDQLGQIAHCLALWDDLVHVQVEAGGDVLEVSAPLRVDSLNGWFETHPRLVKAYRASFVENEGKLANEDMESIGPYGVTVGSHYFVGLG